MNALMAVPMLLSGGPVMLALLVGTGVLLTVRLTGLQLTQLPHALKLVFSHSEDEETSEGDISPFQALTTALAATIGTGNIAGVATAIYLGGPGAVFWMWVCAVFGMSTKYAEAVLAVHYRQASPGRHYAGWPHALSGRRIWVRNGSVCCSPSWAVSPPLVSAVWCSPIPWPWPWKVPLASAR